MKLQEVMGKPAKWSWESKGGSNWVADFISNHIVYTVSMDHIGNDAWHVTFVVNQRKTDPMSLKHTQLGKSTKFGKVGVFDIIGSGNALEVLATVNQVVTDFIKKNKPTTIEFTAEEPSRQKLYKRLTIKLARPLGYEIKKMSRDGIFRMVKK